VVKNEEAKTMSNDFELSRRKALAALGSIGVASAGAGLGTSAYFSDQETFENNRLVAGELDLKMDWEEHYSDWSADEDDDPEDGSLDIRMDAPDDPSMYRRFPVGATEDTMGANPLWVHRDDVPQFMDNTAIDALPDTDNNGTAEFPLDEMFIDGEGPCEYLADVGDDDGGLSSDLRTNNDATSPGDPLINLEDVKPGDFGEVTFSTHICDNPGYLWMNMPGGLEQSENGVTEPEADDPDENGGEPGELADTLETALWYDSDCDNLPDEEARPVDLLVLADISASIDSGEIDTIIDASESFAAELPQDGTVEAGLVTFNGPGEGFDDASPFAGINLQEPIGPLSQFQTGGSYDFEPYFPDAGFGSTPLPAVLDVGRQYLNDTARPNSEKVILLVTDGGPDYPSPSSSFTPYDLTAEGNTYTSDPQDGANDGQASTAEQDETENIADDVKADNITLATVALPFAENPDFEGGGGDPQQDLKNYLMLLATTDFFFDAILNPVDVAAEEAALKISGLAGGGEGGTAEPYIFQGTLAELETALTSDDGLGIPLDANPSTEERDCFNPGVTNCFALSWWLPADHGNEVQSDSVSFDLGFYTEQCRHNDGSGMNNEQVDPEETDA
jgi:predicted ribosomally synthesized peptide with SipW-like signal peptide